MSIEKDSCFEKYGMQVKGLERMVTRIYADNQKLLSSETEKGRELVLYPQGSAWLSHSGKFSPVRYQRSYFQQRLEKLYKE